MAKDQTKEKIITVAEKMFARYGFQKTTVDEIAKAARKAKGSVYYYFDSKEDLFKAVVDREIAILKTELTRVIVDNTDATTMIRNYLMSRMILMKDAVNFRETLKVDFIEAFEFLAPVRDSFTHFEIDLMKAIFDKGVRENTFVIRNTHATAQVIILAVKAIEIPFYQQNKIDEFQENIAELLDIILKGLGK